MSLQTELKDIARVAVYRGEVLAQRLRFAGLKTPRDDWPVLLGISFPKSGTHLLNQILLGFSDVAPFSRHIPLTFAAYDGETGRRRTLQETLAYLDALHPLDVSSAHLFALPEVIERVIQPRFLSYFIYRDPRDVVVSHVFYVSEMLPGHHHYKYYNEVLTSFEERLRVSILGLPDAEVEFPDIAGRFAPYLGWLEQPDVLSLQYEQFVHDRAGMLARVADHFLGRVDTLQATPEAIIQVLEASINPQKSPTFRSGKTGEWMKYFTDEHKQIFKDVAGDLLIRLGYEQSNDW